MTDEISTSPVESVGTQQVPVEPREPAPNPVEKSAPAEPKPEKEDKPDIDTAIKRAFEKSTGNKAPEKEPAAKAEPEKATEKTAKEPEPVKADTPEAKAERQRAADGKFAPKEPKEPSAQAEPADGSGQDGKADARPSEGKDYAKPPAHFLPRAKEAWGGVNPDVQGEVHRMVQNYEKGIAEYKESHEHWSKLKEFHQMAVSAGTTIPDYIRNIRAIESLLQSNPVAGIERVLQQVGVTPEQYARHVLRQPQQEQARQPATDPNLTRQLTEMQRVIQQQQQQFEAMKLEGVINRFIEPFKVDHPRYDELEGDIAFFLNSGKIPSNLSERERLEAAYDMAERINPAPKFDAPRAPGTPANPTRPLDPAGQKSVTGAPNPGLSTSRPPGKEGAKDLDAILKRVLAKATAR